jgi:hypothetical protein
MDHPGPAGGNRDGSRTFRAGPPGEQPRADLAYSSYIDLPEVCDAEQAKRGSCTDPEHFHAWVRLPNKFEHKDIRDEALAAKARKVRALRKDGSNAYEILEEDMDALLREAAVEDLMQEIVAVDHARDVQQAKREVEQIEDEDPAAREGREDDEPVYLYEHIERDQERLNELQDLPADERPEDEYQELLEHVNGFYETLEAKLNEVQEPAKQALRAREKHELVDLIRQARIRAEGTAEFLHVYNAHSWVVGTFRSDKSGRKFGDLEHLKHTAPEVVMALQVTFANLENDETAGKA